IYIHNCSFNFFFPCVVFLCNLCVLCDLCCCVCLCLFVCVSVFVCERERAVSELVRWWYILVEVFVEEEEDLLPCVFLGVCMRLSLTSPQHDHYNTTARIGGTLIVCVYLYL